MKPRNSQSGFSVVELLVVGVIILIATAVSLQTLIPALRAARADSARELLLREIRNGRQISIDRRQVCRVTFVAPRTITTETQNPRANKTDPIVFTQVATVDLPSDISFTVYPGFPNTPATVPDGFGTAIRAIDINNGTNVIYFQPDGSAQAANGTLANGIVYIARNNDLGSARAVTLFGAAARFKTWKLIRTAGGPVWQN